MQVVQLSFKKFPPSEAVSSETSHIKGIEEFR